MTAYERMQQRIDNEASLADYRDLLEYDWSEGEEHQEWVATAPPAEILSWCEAVRGGERTIA